MSLLQEGKHASPGHFASPTRPTGQAALRSIIGFFTYNPQAVLAAPCPKTGKQAENARFKPKIKELAAEKATRVGRKIKVYDYSIPPGSLTASPSQKETP
jgi:hypothetical protein